MLSAHHVGIANRVQKLGFTVVNVTHNRNHRRTRQGVLFIALLFLFQVNIKGFQQFAVFVLGETTCT